MKKRLLYFVTLICSLSLFTACSSDDDTTWKEIPQTEITGSNAVLIVNGTEVTSGSVQMAVNNESEGTLTLKNVVLGYNSVPVNVELKKLSDNSFNFVGTADLYTPPTITNTKSTATIPAILTVEVEGTIYLDGKVSANVTISGIGRYVGVYSADNLILKYSDTELLGKTVAVSVLSADKLALTLYGIIPGESEATIVVEPKTQSNSVSLIGEATTDGGAKVTYNGELVDNNLSLKLDVVLPDAALGGLAGTWPLGRGLYDMTTYEYLENIPFIFEWPALNVAQEPNGEQLSLVATKLVSFVLAEVLNKVTFSPDGNILANYYPSLIFPEGQDVQAWMMAKIFALSSEITIEDREWLTSPKNLAFWYTKEGKLYIVLNLDMILKKVSEDKGMDLTAVSEILKMLATADDTTLMQLIATLAEMDIIKELGLDLSGLSLAQMKEVLGWITTGIPLNYTVKGDVLSVYVDQDMVSPFMPILFSLLPALQTEFEKMVVENPMLGMLPMLLEIEKLTDIKTIWEENTADFKLGINFTK